MRCEKCKDEKYPCADCGGREIDRLIGTVKDSNIIIKFRGITGSGMSSATMNLVSKVSGTDLSKRLTAQKRR